MSENEGNNEDEDGLFKSLVSEEIKNLPENIDLGDPESDIDIYVPSDNFRMEALTENSIWFEIKRDGKKPDISFWVTADENGNLTVRHELR